MRQFILNYELDSKTLHFEFNENVDFEKYNKTIIKLYGKQIKRRYVVDAQTGEIMSLKKLRFILNNLGGGEE